MTEAAIRPLTHQWVVTPIRKSVAANGKAAIRKSVAANGKAAISKSLASNGKTTRG